MGLESFKYIKPAITNSYMSGHTESIFTNENDINLFKGFRKYSSEILNNKCTRKVLFEKVQKDIVVYEGHPGEYIITPEKFFAKQKSLEVLMSIANNVIVSPINMGKATYTNSNWKRIEDPITEDDLVSIYDMFS